PARLSWLRFPAGRAPVGCWTAQLVSEPILGARHPGVSPTAHRGVIRFVPATQHLRAARQSLCQSRCGSPACPPLLLTRWGFCVHGSIVARRGAARRPSAGGGRRGVSACCFIVRDAP